MKPSTVLLMLLALLFTGCGAPTGSSDDDDDNDAADDDDDDATDPPSDEDPLPADFAAALQQRLEFAQEDYAAPGIQVAVKAPGYAVWTSATGGLSTDDRLKIGSITQTFVAAVALQLRDEDELPLANLVGEWVDGASWNTTISQALNHVGGVPDYANDPSFDWTGTWNPEELVGLVANEPALFGPGTDFHFARTNYALAALAIEEATGNDWEDEVRSRLLDPLGLSRTRIPDVGDGWGSIAPGMSGGTDVSNGNNPSAFGPSGNMTSTASNLARFGGHLFEGDVLSDEARWDMYGHPFTIDSGDAWGLGVQTFGNGPFDTRQVASQGAVEGYSAWMGYREDLETVVVVLTNGWLDDQGGTYTRWIANEFWTLAEQYVEPPVGDDDDSFNPLPEPGGQMRFVVHDVLPHIGTPASPDHDGVALGGWWDYDNDGGTVGYLTVTSANFSSGQPVGAVECQLPADGTYNPADREYSITGTLSLESWGGSFCEGWPGFEAWHERLQQEFTELQLVPRDEVLDGWGIDGALDSWSATAPADHSIPFVILADGSSLFSANAQTPPFATVGHYWQLPADRMGPPPN